MKFVTWYVMIFIVIIMLAGIVTDSLGKMHTLQQAITIAQSAARAGTNAATGTSTNGDAFDLSTQMAATAAQNYLASADVRGTVSVNGDTVSVTVNMTYEPRMLGPIQLPLIPVEATGSARLIGN